MISYFLKRSVVTICLNVFIFLLGIFSFDKIAREFIPAIDIPAVAVVYPTTFLPHEQIIDKLVEPFESNFLRSGHLDRIETNLEEGKVIFLLFFKWSLKPEECLQEARQFASSIKRPQGVLDPIFILHRPTLSPIFRVVFYGKEMADLTQSAKLAAVDLERLPGISQINLIGDSPKKGFLNFDVIKAAQYKVTPDSIFAAATQTWSFRTLLFPSLSDQPPSLVKIRINDLKDLENLPVKTTTGSSVPLRWVGEIRLDSEAPKVFYRQGEAAVILEVIKAPGADAVTITDQVINKLEEMKLNDKTLGQTIIYNEGEKIKDSQAGVFTNFLSGIFLNSLILMIFLGSVTGVVVASSIFPTTVLGTLFILKQAGISLNIFSLNGFSLAAGMITDASTVVLESVMRRFQKGEEIEQASLRGTKDVLVGIITGTLSSAAVMVPICLQSGVSSKLFSDLGYTLVVTQLVSLITVFSFVPWLCFKTLKKDSQQIAPIELLFQLSSKLVKTTSSFAKTIFIQAEKNISLAYGIPILFTIVCFGSLFFLPPSELLPIVKADTYSISIPFPRTILKEKGTELSKALSLALSENENLEKDLSWAVTTSNSDSIEAVFQAKTNISLVELRSVVSKKLNIESQKIIIFPLGPTPPTEPMNYSGYYYISKSVPLEKLTELKQQFCSFPGIVDCTDENHYISSKIILKSRALSMARQETNPIRLAVNATLQTQAIDLSTAANLPLPIPFLFRVQSQNLLHSPILFGKDENQIGTLATNYDLIPTQAPLARHRSNIIDYNPLYFRTEGVTLGQVTSHMQSLIKSVGLGKTDVLGMGGILNMEETFSKMILALAVSMLLTFIILMLQFKSVIQTLIVMYSIPLSIGGAVFGLLLLGETVNVSVLVGFILLGGIVVNNGIMLLESFNQKIDEGLNISESIITAVQDRTRPILMTSIASIAGMLPTLLFESEGQELYRGMAIVNIFGMFFGTFLTLIVTPVTCKLFLSKGKTSYASNTNS